jgi:hypothetical protein
MKTDGQEQHQGQREAACRSEISAWTGLRQAAPASWDWIEAGSAPWKNRGLASFCRPAKQNVNRGRCAAGAMRGQDTAPTTPEPVWMPLVTLRASRPASDSRG